MRFEQETNKNSVTIAVHYTQPLLQTGTAVPLGKEKALWNDG
jgi:hypothetical protein